MGRVLCVHTAVDRGGDKKLTARSFTTTVTGSAPTRFASSLQLLLVRTVASCKLQSYTEPIHSTPLLMFLGVSHARCAVLAKRSGGRSLRYFLSDAMGMTDSHSHWSDGRSDAKQGFSYYAEHVFVSRGAGMVFGVVRTVW